MKVSDFCGQLDGLVLERACSSGHSHHTLVRLQTTTGSLIFPSNSSVMTIAKTETVNSYSGLASIQRVQCKESLPLGPQSYFMAIQTIEREVGHMQKATRELDGGTSHDAGGSCVVRMGRLRFRQVRAMPMNNSLAHFLAQRRAAQAEHNPSAASQQNVARFSELSPMISLNFEQTVFHAGGAAQQP
jgi:hypothetical protein